MEDKEKSRPGSFAPALAIALGCALAGLLLSTFLLCNTFIQQFLPLILFAGFLLVAFFVQRMRWARAHLWLFYAVCVALAIACGFVIRTVF